MPQKQSQQPIESIPAFSNEAEAAILSSCIAAPEHVMDVVAQNLRVEDFYRTFHRQVYRAITKLFMLGEPVDYISIVETDPDINDFSLTELADNYISYANIEHHVKKVKSLSLARRVTDFTHQILAESVECRDGEHLLSMAQSKFFSLEAGKSSASMVGEHVPEIIRKAEYRRDNPGIIGLPTGIAMLDGILDGFQPTFLYVLAGRPGMGKTALALNMLMAISGEKKHSAGIFSLEMAAVELSGRMLSISARVDARDMRAGRLEGEPARRFEYSIPYVKEMPLSIDDDTDLNEVTMISKARGWKRTRDIKIVFIDYLQLMRTVDRHSTKDIAIGEITRAAKKMAKTLEIPVVLLSQMNRQNEQRADKTPILSDLRESGNIEQDADVVMFIHRPDMDSTEAKIIVAKQRNGPVGSVGAVFDEKSNRFYDSGSIDGVHNG